MSNSKIIQTGILHDKWITHIKTEFWFIFAGTLEVYFLWCPLLLLRTLPSVALSLVRWLFASVRERPFFLCVIQYHDGIGSKQSSSIFSENSAPLHSTSSLCGEFHLDVRECELLLIFLYFKAANKENLENKKFYYCLKLMYNLSNIFNCLKALECCVDQ
mgnify:CR=1 FL=1